MISRSLYIVAVLFLLTAGACKQKYTPKPYGYFRIDFPDKNYHLSDLNVPFQFEYPSYAKLVRDTLAGAEPYWMNISIPKYKSKIHLSYKTIDNNLAKLIEDSRELAYKHSIKASAINEKLYLAPDRKVYGTIYEIKGNVASSLQFHLTDSTKNFIRGSFYISEIPNYDSLHPVIEFIDEDIYHLIETFSWK